MIETIVGVSVEPELLQNYFRALVNRFFKILPIREQNEESLVVYMTSLQSELLGCREFICVIKNDPEYLTLLSILQYLIDNPSISVRETKREVFRAISICNKLKAKYTAVSEVL